MRVFKLISLFYIMALMIFWLSACSQNDSADDEQISKKHLSQIAIPSQISTAALPSGATLVAEIYMDYADSSASPRATQNLILPVSGNVSFSLANIPVGRHTFTIIFKYTDDPDFAGTFELARATSNPINIGSGSNPGFAFANTDFDTSADDDNDGVSNLVELDADQLPRSNPGDSTCVLDKSILQNDVGQGCTLG